MDHTSSPCQFVLLPPILGSSGFWAGPKNKKILQIKIPNSAKHINPKQGQKGAFFAVETRAKIIGGKNEARKLKK